MAARSIRNNNPFNIRLTHIKWRGKVPNSQNTDKVFEQFTSLDYGIRAAMINMRTHIRRGYTTLQELIHKHAPAHENPTSSFIQYLYKTTGLKPTDTVDYKNREQYVKLVKSISDFEAGTSYNINPFYKAYDAYIR